MAAVIETLKTEDGIVPQQLDEFSYLETGGFSSERFKIEVQNLPKFYGISEFRKLLTKKLLLKPTKVKPPHKKSKWIYVCFQNDEDRDKATSQLNGYLWKGNALKCKIAEPMPDPLVRKRKLDTEENEHTAKKKIDMGTQEERLKNSSIPYWNIPYEKQVELKHKSIREVLLKLGNTLWRMNHDLKDYITTKRKAHNGLLCELEPVKTVKKIEGYRNKCEFTIGMDSETGLPTVGFRLGTYISGFTGVAPVDKLCHISDEMKKAVLLFQDFVRTSDMEVYSPEKHSGYWKQLAVRQSGCTRELMLIISVHSQDLTDDEMDTLKTKLKEYLIKDKKEDFKIESIYFITLLKRDTGKEEPSKMEHLYGETHIHDYIHGLKFRISPQAFFQVNTNAAEILYQSAIDISQPDKQSTVLDICCGTGTIGLCFAKYCDQVLGLEIIPEAVVDAKANSSFNNINNAEFFTGKAEDILSSVIFRAKNKNIIAIVDPPRSGLHMRAVVQLRKMRDIKKLVYISCDPMAAMKNFVDLGRASSKTMQGDPFIPTKAIAIDMFPFTKHTEMVLLFERMSNQEKNSEIEKESVETKPEVEKESVEIKSEVEKESDEIKSKVEKASDETKSEIEEAI